MDDHQMPAWVKAFFAIGILLALTVAAVLLLGGGDHGPGRHTPAQTCDDCPRTACQWPACTAAPDAHCEAPCRAPVCLCEAS